MPASTAIFVAPFGELADPRIVVRLAARAEERGWDGMFLWDHVRYSPPSLPVADPWVVMAAIAAVTTRLRLGPLVTPPGRRRIHKLSREVVTLDHLSGGRTVLGLGLGSDRHGELGPFGDPTDPKELARLLDAGLEQLTGYWAGELEPRPIQRPRIPIWLASRWPNRRPVRRAAQWDGLFPIELPGPEALVELAGEIAEARPAGAGAFDLVVENPPGTDPAPWEAAGATWCLTGFDSQPTEAEVRAAIDAGPRG